jgi:hypothetical protein
VLFFTTSVGEAEINELNVVVLHHLHYVGNCHLILLDCAYKKTKNLACLNSKNHANGIFGYLLIFTYKIGKENKNNLPQGCAE